MPCLYKHKKKECPLREAFLFPIIRDNPYNLCNPCADYFTARSTSVVLPFMRNMYTPSAKPAFAMLNAPVCGKA